MLSNAKLYTLFLLSTITAGVNAGSTDPSLSKTPYKTQEAAFLEAKNPEKDVLGVIHFLQKPADFAQHKATLFAGLKEEAQLRRLDIEFTKDYANTTQYAAHITVEDAREINSKNRDLPVCKTLAPVLMVTPLKTLRAFDAECIEVIVKEATSINTSTAFSDSCKKLATQFIENSYKLDKRIWEKNFEALKNLTKVEENYSKYGTHFELLIRKDEDCGELDAHTVLNSITPSQAAKLTRPSCFTSMNGYKSFKPTGPSGKAVKQLPKDIFAEVEVDNVLYKDVYYYMTSEQVANFGSKLKENRCAALNVSQLFKGRQAHINAACWNSYLLDFAPGADSTPPLNKYIKLIRQESWEGVQVDGFSRIHPDDLQHIPTPIMTKFLAANPNFCESLEKLDTQKLRIASIPDCFVRTNWDKQLKNMEKLGSSFPIPTLAKFSRESVSKCSDGMGFLRHVKFTPEQIMAIGRDSSKPEEHPCADLSKDDLLNTESLMNNMSAHCFAALNCLGELQPSDLSRIPKKFIALLPYDKLMLMVGDDSSNASYFSDLDVTGMKHLTTKDFCAKVTEPVFRQIKAPALAAVDARCAADLTFKKSLTEAQIRAFSPGAFADFTDKMMSELPALTILTPEQFQQLSANVKDVKQSAGQLLTKEVLAGLPKEYTAKLSEGLLAATPAASFAVFSTKDAVVALPPASLRRVTGEQVKAIPVEAVSALTVAQVQELGVALTEASTSPITHLLNDKNVKLSTESQAAANKRAEEDEKRFVKAAATDKKENSASTVGVSALGLLLAAVALVF